MTSNTTSSSSSTNELFLRFKDAGLSLELVIFSTIKLAFSIMAQLFSASLVYVSLRSKSLRESYNILIGANCAFCFCYMFTFAIQFGIAISGQNFIPLRHCFPLMIVPIFCVQCQYLLYLALAIDRLFVALFPFWHLKNIQKSVGATRFYLALIFGPILTYAALMVYTGVDFALVQYPEKFVTCSTSDAVPGFVFQIPVYFNFLSLLSYIFLCFVVRKKTESSAANFKTTRKILNSIMAVFLLEFAGWFSNTLVRNVLAWANVGQMRQWYVMNVAGMVLIPCLAMYAPLLYIMSADYGRAFYRCFGIHFPFSNKQANATTSIGPVTAPLQQLRARSLESCNSQQRMPKSPQPQLNRWGA